MQTQKAKTILSDDYKTKFLLESRPIKASASGAMAARSTPNAEVAGSNPAWRFFV
jgi:hypothetical protein